MAFLLSVFADKIIQIVGSPRYLDSYSVIPYLAGSLVFYGFSVLFSSGLYVAGKTKVLAGVVGMCSLINVVLNILLIPRLGKEGAAIATFATNAVMAGVILRFSQAHYRIPFKLRRTLSGIGLAAVAVAALAGYGGSVAETGLTLRVLVAVGVTGGFLGIFGMSPARIREGFKALSSVFRSSPPPSS
jgi:O-antigen/teichoic acid export membrane protein